MIIYRQAFKDWSRETIKVRATMGAQGCVISAAAHLRNYLFPRTVPWTPFDVLRLLRVTKGALVDGRGREPGDLMVWPAAVARMQLACGDAVASGGHATLTGDEAHEFVDHLVDANADLAGALASAMVDGVAAVRVDTDGDGVGNHTIACLKQSDDGRFMCVCSALGDVVWLDQNLENADVHWGATPRPYRAVGIRPVYLPPSPA